MSATVLFHHFAKRRLYVHVQRISIFRAQHLSSNVENGEQKREEETERTLVYKPSAYYQTPTARNTTAGCLETKEESSSSLSLNTTFHQQRNLYRISSRQLSSTKNMPSSMDYGNAESNQEPRVTGDPRAFQRCRPEYQNMTYDVSQRSSTLDLNEALLVLEKVTELKSNMGPSDATSFLCKLSQIPHEQIAVVRKDARFNALLQHSAEILHNFTPAELLDTLRSFVDLGLPKFHSILGLYETEFCRRVSEMEIHQLLLAADLWRCLGRFVPRYLEKLFDKVSQNFNQLGLPELLQLMYVIGEGRRCPDALVQPIESLLMRYLNQLKPEELEAVSLALFKSQISLSERAARRLVDRALAVVDDLSDFGIANVMKLMRFSYLDHLPWLEAMGSEVPRRAPRMEVQGLMHVVLSCSALHYRDHRILLAVAEELPNVVDRGRSKDAAKMLWAFGTLGVLPNQSPKLYPCLTAILRERQLEFQRFPEHLLTGLLGLAFVGLFPEDLLSLALSEEFVNKTCNSKTLELKKDLFTLDGTVGLELPGSKIPRLSHAIREEVTEQLWDFAQSDICRKPEILEAEVVLQKLLGGEMFVRKHMILPHLRSIDLEVHLDQNDQPVPVSSETPASQNWEQTLSGVTITDDLLAQLTNSQKIPVQPSNKFLQKPVVHAVEPVHVRESIFSVGVDLTDDLLMALTKSGKRLSSHSGDSSKPSIQRLAVQVTNRNQYCYRTEQLLGFHALKRRQLLLSGYRVVELPHWEWFPLLRRSHAEKLAYMHCKIFSDTGSKK
ncbi:FAST kinase domain-containing protein 5, mitochondrial [Pimephales promelas]|uniref:FAST kinase domain-containing protein 5, mitochondrial n=1 Tax=Pimephales promelas TaxID=90988 RepID=UPI001955C727|nr:FAST kinase domain-containing protein 5, mitochondrial [Pimephales promelas]XP_039517477.1 FAST kinase domain-containing protein 5, mitochondrial [Pimephales promelas]